MKKALSLILALAMALSLFACGGGGTPAASDAAPAASDAAAPAASDAAPAAPAQSGPEQAPADGTVKAYPNANPDGSLNLDTIGHYDPEYDYTQNTRFKIAYLATENSFLYQMAADAYEHWVPIFNCEYAGFLAANSDSDLFLTNLQNLIDQGVTGFILDPDTTVFPAIIEKLEAYPEVKWMSQMAPPRDGATGDGLPIGGNLINPYVGFDNFDAGAQQIYKLVEWKEANLKDVPYEEIGLLSMGFSSSPPLQERVIGAKAAWEKSGVSTSGPNYFEVDSASAGLTLNGGLEAATPVITTHGEYKHWLVMGLIDDLGQACAQVIEQQGLTDGSCVVTFGGSGFIAMWDGESKNACRYALYTANNLYSEPIMGAVYAYLMGWATPDTIWPSWVKWDDHGAGDRTIPQLRLPTVWLEQDDYKHYLEWSDLYAKANEYNYDVPGLSLDDYTAFIDVPADFAKP